MLKRTKGKDAGLKYVLKVRKVVEQVQQIRAFKRRSHDQGMEL